MKITVKKEITFASFRKLIFKSNLGKVYARFEGKASFSVETEDTEKDKVELTISKDAELKINDLIFGASGSFSVSKDKVEFKLGIEEFEVTFDPFSLNPVSFHLPSIKLPVAGQAFRLEQELPGLGLKGTAEIELEFVIDFIPDYKRLAKAVNAKNFKAAAQLAKNQLYKFGKLAGKAGKTVAKLVIRAGRAAVYAPFNALGNYIGRNLAMQSWTRMATSQSAQLGKMIKGLGKLVGAAGYFITIWLTVRDAIPGVLNHVHQKVVAVVNQTFVEGYVTFLVAMTDENIKPADGFFDFKTKLERTVSDPPDFYSVVEHLSRTGDVKDINKHAGNWRDEQLSKGVPTKKYEVDVTEAQWQVYYREAYSLYFIFMDIALNSSSAAKRKEAWRILQVAHKLVKAAGMIACYQDVVAFVGASSIYEDVKTGAQPADIWEDWNGVKEFHKEVFGASASQRESAYLGLVDVKALKISIPPFGDYA